ncbi:MFS transporter [Enterococcus saccharolyticus]|uniref:Multidrug MFS transporter n=1 Tax=Candidatus Enterococcus willemsii TaxID=1857215 RepID=A0ABQ6Z026_9ENTE|nr:MULTISPECIES: MFS transporter [Enterococcus]KAF1304279.1 multidrug MFS transporter [Enterococcus sp. CU12B]MCD5003385.1 MFS transporter [Enterococcus saccharolyticus]
MEKSKLWTKDFITVTLVNFLAYLVYYLLMIIIAEYAMDSLSATPSQAGGAVGIFIIGALIARLLTGGIIERVGYKRMLFIGLAIYLVASLFYYGAHSLLLLMVVRFLHGVGFGSASVVTSTIAAQIIPVARRGEGIGYYSLSTTMASAIGPMLGMFLVRQLSFYAIVTVSIVLLVVAGIGAFILNIPKSHYTPDYEKSSISIHHFLEMKAVPISLIGILLGVGYSSIVSFLTSYTSEIGLVAAGSFFFIVYSVAILFSRPVAGRLIDTKGENFVMYPSFISFTIGLFLMGIASNGVILLLSAVFIGAGFGTFLSSGQTIAIKVAPEHRVGLATSTFLAIVDAAVGIGPSILGALVPIIGYNGVYVSMAVVALVAGVLYFIFNKQILNKK